MSELDQQKKWRVLMLLALAELLAMCVWFSASAVTPALTALWSLDESGQSWLTMSVQIGFVVGAIGSAVLTLADRIPPKWFFVGATIASGIATGLIPLIPDSATIAFILRFLTGVFLAGVYPVGMKLMASWTQADRGLGIGILVGALVLGSASPHLIRSFGSFENWQLVLFVAAILSFISAVIGALFIEEGPYRYQSPPFRLSEVKKVLTDRKVMLANLGYLGHMWELYAMWAWLSLFLSASFAISGTNDRWASIITFAAISMGGIGSVIAGKLADRIGRSTVTSASLILSGGCALVVGQFFGGNPILLTIIVLIWGFAIVADSAQFSASVSEHCDRTLIGTALTLQTSMGFLLTLFSIRMVPSLVNLVGWQWAFAFLALGPVVGVWAMQNLKQIQNNEKVVVQTV